MLSDDDELHLLLCKKERWQIDENPDRFSEDRYLVTVNSGRQFVLAHPYSLHTAMYRDAKEPNERFLHMKAAHDYLWPQYAITWNDWDEARYYAHCMHYSQIIQAGGGGIGKSDTTARIVLQWWLASPRTRAGVIASVTLESLQTRIWGYMVRALNSVAIPVGAKDLGGQSPKIIFPGVRDKIHGLFAVPVKEGADDVSTKTLSNLVGRHPEEGLMMVLDEAPFMSPKVVDVIPNLEKGVEFFQLWAIGNSDSWDDLHGALATPKKGIDSIDPARDEIWPTMHDNSVCLYFYPYKSPAITDPDPIKRGMLAKFLTTTEKIAAEERVYGKDSENFWKMTLGFWRPGRAGSVIVTEKFLTEQAVHDVAEWSGFYALNIVAGLDSAMEVGGTGCKLRMAILGHTMDGSVCLDFKEEELLFPIAIKVTHDDSGEKQLCERVIDKLIEWQCPLANLALDATGVGRAVGGLLSVYYMQRKGVWEEPYRIISARQGSGQKKEDDPMVMVYTPTDLWVKFRDFVMRNQIRGLDRKTIKQFVNRLLVRKGEGETKKWVLESKGDFRSRMSAKEPALAHSPDEADAAVLCCLAAQLRFGFSPGQKRDLPNNKDFDEFFAQKVAILHRQGLSAGETLRKIEEVKRAPVIRASFGKSLEESLALKRGR